MLWLILLFAPAAFGATEWWSRAVLESLIFALGAMCALRPDVPRFLDAPVLGFFAVVVIGIVQLLNARLPSDPSALGPSTLSRPQTIYAILLWLSWTSLAWSASGILRWEGASRRLAWAILGIGFFIAVAGILQRGQGNEAYYGLRVVRHGRPFGPFTNYDHAATWLVASFFIGMGVFVDGFKAGRLAVSERIAKQGLIVFVLLILAVAICETGSRGGVNAFFFSALATGILASGAVERTSARNFLRLSLLAVACCYAVFLYFNPRWMGFVDGALDNSAAYRVSLYRSGLRLFADFPLFGVGLGGFQTGFRPYQESLVRGLVDHVHSSWFEVGLETGVVGFLAFGAGILAPLHALCRRLTSSGTRSRAIIAGCFGALAAFLFHGLVEFSFQIPGAAVLFVVLVAEAGVLGRHVSTEGATLPRAQRTAQAGILIALSLLSLPPGLAGGTPRFGAPFESEADSIMPAQAGWTKDAASVLGWIKGSK